MSTKPSPNIRKKYSEDKEPCEAVHFKTDEGESLALIIQPTGVVTIWATKIDSKTTLGSLNVTGFTVKEAKAKSKGFWGKLWGKIKGAVKAVIKAITFPLGPLTCRPTASVGVNKGKPNRVTIGIGCQ